MSLSEWDSKMNEENLGVFDARHLVQNEHDTLKPCILFLTRNRIVAVLLEGINPWTVVTVIVALAASFIGLLLRNFALFLGGFSIGIIAGLCIVLIDFVIRHKEFRKIKRLNPEHILEMTEKSFEIHYEKIAKVEVRIFNRYSGISGFMPSLPSLQEHHYVITFVTSEKKHTFILDGNKLKECLGLIREFVPETTEITEID